MSRTAVTSASPFNESHSSDPRSTSWRSTPALSGSVSVKISVERAGIAIAIAKPAVQVSIEGAGVAVSTRRTRVAVSIEGAGIARASVGESDISGGVWRAIAVSVAVVDAAIKVAVGIAARRADIAIAIAVAGANAAIDVAVQIAVAETEIAVAVAVAVAAAGIQIAVAVAAQPADIAITIAIAVANGCRLCGVCHQTERRQRNNDSFHNVLPRLLARPSSR